MRTFDSLWKPHYSDVCAWIHKNTTWKTFKHSCGASERFFESMIDAGIDIINPVQCSAKGDGPAHAEGEVQGPSRFLGGRRRHAKNPAVRHPGRSARRGPDRCEIFSESGGFVFNTIHNVQAGTPVENMVAMIDAVKEFNGTR